MAQFVVRRVLYSVVTLLILSGTIFLIVRLTGDPVALMAEAGARPEDLERALPLLRIGRQIRPNPPGQRPGSQADRRCIC